MAKGGSFERKIAKRISLWWTGRDDSVWRTAGSGARATMRAKKNKCTANSEGDLCYLDDESKDLFELFVFELKKGYSKDIDVLSLIDGFSKKNLIYSWWMKISAIARKINRSPLLIIERNGKSPVIIYDYQVPWGSIFHIPAVPNGNTLLWRSADKGLYLAFTLLEDFLERYKTEAKGIANAQTIANQKLSGAQADGVRIPPRSECDSPGRNTEPEQHRKDFDRKGNIDAGEKFSGRGKMVSQQKQDSGKDIHKSKIRRLRNRILIKKNSKK